jgi:hypothetical protein
MNYVRYDPETGNIKKYGLMPVELILQEIAQGKPTLLVENIDDFNNWKVNLNSKIIERINPVDPIPDIPQEIIDLIGTTTKI